MSSLQHRLGAIVREARREQGWSQERLAEVSKLDRSYVGEIERGLVSPTLATLEKLALALGLQASALLGRCESVEESDLGFIAVQQAAGDSP